MKIIVTHIKIKENIELIDVIMWTSAAPKKLQRKPLTKYKTGLNLEMSCQVVGNIEML